VIDTEDTTAAWMRRQASTIRLWRRIAAPTANIRIDVSPDKADTIAALFDGLADLQECRTELSVTRDLLRALSARAETSWVHRSVLEHFGWFLLFWSGATVLRLLIEGATHVAG